MRRLTAILDWRNSLSLAAVIVVSLVALSVVESFATANQAIRSRDRTAATASQRIDALQAQIRDLSGQLTASDAAAASARAELLSDVAALQSQLEHLGASPVVPRTATATTASTIPGRATTSPATPATPTTAAPRPPPTTTTPPSTSTTTTRPCIQLPAAAGCI